MKNKFRAAKPLAALILAAAVSLTVCACGNNSDKKDGKISDKTSSAASEKSDGAQLADYELVCDEDEIGFSPDCKLIERAAQGTIDIAKAVCAGDTDEIERLLNTSVTQPLYKTDFSADGAAKTLTEQYSGKFTFEQLCGRVTKIEVESYYDVGGSLKHGTITEDEFADFQKKFEEQGLKLESELAEMTLKLYIDGDEPIVIGASAVCWDGEVGFNNFGLIALADYQVQLEIADANEKAKSAFDAVNYYATERKQDGEAPVEETLDAICGGDIDLAESSGGTVGELCEKLKEFCGGGVVRVIKIGEKNCAVQWKESADSEVVGQYPVPSDSENLEKIEWGTYLE